MLASFWQAGSLEVTAESQVQVHPFAKTRGTDLRVLDFRGEVFTGETQDGEHVGLALFELLPAEFHRVSAARNGVAQCAFAFTQIIIVSESVFHIFERAQRRPDVARGGGFLLGSAKILCSFEFAAEENRLSDSGGKSPDEGIEHPDRVELGGSESAPRAKRKARQTRGASLVHPMKGRCETAFAGDEVGPAFENLRWQTCGHA